MRQIIPSKKIHARIWNLILGYSLIAIVIYIFYRVVSFTMRQIDMPSTIIDFGLAAFVIAGTMYASLLLRYDMKPVRIPMIINHSDQLQKETN